ncbi:MAG: GTP-binding protein HSR1 [Methylococcaceae bacterium]|nr:MAG: GTP-binding protein HSR1 [Methylococcaceae bacterium]
MRLSWRWLGVIILFALPWLLLVLAGLANGAYWLWQQQLLPLWLALLVFVTALAWLFAIYLHRKRHAPFRTLPTVAADALWSPDGQAAWQKVLVMAADIDVARYPLSDAEKLWALAWQVVGDMARHFNPGTARPELAVPLPYILIIGEKVSHDLRLLLIQYLPLSHRLTVADAVELWRGVEAAGTVGDVLRVGRLAFNPLGGLLGEAGIALMSKVLRYPQAQLQRWVLETFIKKVGYYAIALYSGQLPLQEGPVETLSDYSAADLAHADRPRRPQEPLRILVAGQLKAGKSSLINGLFGELRAGTDALPLTTGLTPYRLERGGVLQALVFDSEGYGEDVAAWCRRHQACLTGIDLLLLVCSATQAARQADALFLQQLRELYAAHPERAAPVQLLVLTHIDQLRPLREWRPPYDLSQSAVAGENSAAASKAQSILAAMAAVGTALHVPVADIVPVSSQTSEPYNLDALWTSIAVKLPDAQRACYLRCLRDKQAAQNWPLLWRQLLSSGRMLLGSVKDMLA